MPEDHFGEEVAPWYDETSADMFEPAVVEPVVEFLAELAGEGGAALELGIGGSRKPEALKCLHAHVAFALARPGYRVGEAILDEVPEQWPAKCCTDLSLASPR